MISFSWFSDLKLLKCVKTCIQMIASLEHAFRVFIIFIELSCHAYLKSSQLKITFDRECCAVVLMLEKNSFSRLRQGFYLDSGNNVLIVRSRIIWSSIVLHCFSGRESMVLGIESIGLDNDSLNVRISLRPIICLISGRSTPWNATRIRSSWKCWYQRFFVFLETLKNVW